MGHRGFREERELVNRLERLGFAVLRAPASGARTKLDRPDILAGRRGYCIAVEVKTTKGKVLYVRAESLEQLVRFADRFGAEPYLAVKFKKSGYDWLLLKPEQVKRTGKGYRITVEEASRRGVPLEALASARLDGYREG